MGVKFCSPQGHQEPSGPWARGPDTSERDRVAVGERDQLGPGELLVEPRERLLARVAEHQVVDLHRALRVHRPHEVDEVAELRPRPRGRHQERPHRCRRHEVGVTRVVDVAVDHEADVRHRRDVGVDHGVVPADGLDPEARGLEHVTGADGGDASVVVAELRGDRRRCPHAQVGLRVECRSEDRGVDVVRVVVGDEHGGGAGDQFGSVRRVRTGVDDERPVTVGEDDGRVGVLGEVHAPKCTAHLYNRSRARRAVALRSGRGRPPPSRHRGERPRDPTR